MIEAKNLVSKIHSAISDALSLFSFFYYISPINLPFVILFSVLSSFVFDILGSEQLSGLHHSLTGCLWHFVLFSGRCLVILSGGEYAQFLHSQSESSTNLVALF